MAAIPEQEAEVAMRHRETMDVVVGEVKQAGGRQSLSSQVSELEEFDFKETDSPRLLAVIAQLSYAGTRVAEDNDKYIVPRDGITSFVFLAGDKSTSPSRKKVH